MDSPCSKRKKARIPLLRAITAAPADDGVVSPSAYSFSSCSLGFGLCLSFSRYDISCSLARCCWYENTHMR